jgi:hypothetical protein
VWAPQEALLVKELPGRTASAISQHPLDLLNHEVQFADAARGRLRLGSGVVIDELELARRARDLERSGCPKNTRPTQRPKQHAHGVAGRYQQVKTGE